MALNVLMLVQVFLRQRQHCIRRRPAVPIPIGVETVFTNHFMAIAGRYCDVKQAHWFGLSTATRASDACIRIPISALNNGCIFEAIAPATSAATAPLSTLN